jgi:hypothetical protein
MPLLTIFQVYSGGQFLFWGKKEDQEKTPTLRKSLTKFYTIILSAVINNNNLINILTYMVLVIRLCLQLSLALLIEGIIKSIMINILVLF